MSFFKEITKTVLLVLSIHQFSTVSARPSNVIENAHLGTAGKLFHGLYEQFHTGVSNIPTWLGVGDPPEPTKVKVNIVGLGRTGTTSLAVAMDLLGYTVLHDEETPRVYDLYRDFYAGKISDNALHEGLGNRGFNATFRSTNVDWASKQDGVKVILTVRDDVSRWVDSWRSVAYLGDLLHSAPFSWVPSARGLRAYREHAWKHVPTGGRPELYLDPETLREGYHLHYNNVVESIPKERLLIFNVKQGWEPLCEFLDVPVPDIPFPFVNDKTKVRGLMLCYEIIVMIFMPWPLYLVLIASWIIIRQTKKTSCDKIISGIKRKEKYCYTVTLDLTDLNSRNGSLIALHRDSLSSRKIVD